MTRTAAALLFCALALSACGADGPPNRPTKPEPPQGNLTVTGEARFGVTASN
jgi:ABC-type glycerol-3-phosphate transport system substrate-binding protein